MTLEKIIDEFKLEKLGVSLEIQSKSKTNFSKIKKCKYIDTYEYWYDGEDDLDWKWIEVEGIQYGWIWCDNWFRRHSKILQRLAIRKHAQRLLNLLYENSPVLTYEFDDCSYYGFMLGSDCYVVIRTSDNELDSMV